MENFKRRLKIGITAVILLFAVAACGSGKPSSTTSPTAVALVQTATKLSTPMPGVLPTGTQSPTPRSKLKIFPTATPYPTRILTPTQAKTPTQSNTPTTTPIPIEPPSTPAMGPEAYRLKQWNAEEAWKNIQLVGRYADQKREEEIYFSQHSPPAKYSDTAVWVAEKEGVLRYQNTSMGDKFKWAVAKSEAIGGYFFGLRTNETEPDRTILKLLQKAFESGQYTTQNIQEAVSPNGFEIEYWLAVDNLFGDDRTADILQLSTQEWGDGLIIAVINKDEQSQYQIIPIDRVWDYSFVWYKDVFTADNNQNGLPEVIVQTHNHNGTSCVISIHIMEWRNDHFVNLGVTSSEPAGIQTYDCSSSWEYGPADERGIRSILASDPISMLHEVMRQRTYTWNGTAYELTDVRVIPPAEIGYWTADWVDYGIEDGEYQLLIDKLRKPIAEWPIEYADRLGPSYADYLRFETGMAYAFDSQINKARETLQSLVDSPIYPITKTVSLATQLFLDNYKTREDVYRACQAANSFMLNMVVPYRDDISHFYEEVLDKWGYTPWGETYSICSPRAALRTLVSHWYIDQAKDALEWLKYYGVPVRMGKRIDLDGDGIQDWAFIVDTPGGEAQFEPWVMLVKETGLQVHPLVNIANRRYELLDRISSQGIFRVETLITPDNPRPMVLLRSGYYLFIFRVTQRGEETKIHSLVNEALVGADNSIFNGVLSGVNNYFLYQDAGRLKLDVVYNEYLDLPWWEPYGYREATYLWNPDVDNFNLVDERDPVTIETPWWEPTPMEALAQQAVTEIFDHSNYKAAIPLLIRALAFLEEKDELDNGPSIRYLLGLAYELIGDERNAVQAYWQLWQDDPTSTFAFLARAKLQVIQPE